ncbi:MAG: hypothetical protein ACYC9Y_02285 [Candidatus Methylomirabilia bacterium]
MSDKQVVVDSKRGASVVPDETGACGQCRVEILFSNLQRLVEHPDNIADANNPAFPRRTTPAAARGPLPGGGALRLEP